MRRPDAAPAAPTDRAVYRLAKPLMEPRTKVATAVIEMRGIADRDRELLEHYRGNTVALTRELIGALCSLSPDQVARIARTDYAMLAEDVQWQMEEAAQRFGLPRSYFIQAKGSEA